MLVKTTPRISPRCRSSSSPARSIVAAAAASTKIPAKSSAGESPIARRPRTSSPEEASGERHVGQGRRHARCAHRHRAGPEPQEMVSASLAQSSAAQGRHFQQRRHDTSMKRGVADSFLAKHIFISLGEHEGASRRLTSLQRKEFKLPLLWCARHADATFHFRLSPRRGYLRENISIHAQKTMPRRRR